MIDRLRTGGTEKQLVTLIRRLDRTRVVPSLCLLDGEDSESRSLEPADCPVLRLGVRSLMRPKSCRQTVRLAAFLRRQRIDVLQLQFADSTYLGALAGVLARVPCIVRTRRDLGLMRTAKLRWFGRHLDGLLNRFCVDAMIANSNACRQAVREQEHPAPKWIEVLPNGVDLSRFDVDTSPALRAPRLVGMVGNLRPEKNPDVFVRTARIVCQAMDDVVFEIAGDGPMRVPLQGLIEEMGLAGKVFLRGNVADVPSFLAEVEVAVLCSSSEGSPNAVIEYMAAGKAIVATGIGGTSELFEHEQHGLFVPPNDADSMADAILRLLRDRGLAKRLGAAARRRARNYDVAAMTARYEQFYGDLVSRSTACRRRHSPQGLNPVSLAASHNSSRQK